MLEENNSVWGAYVAPTVHVKAGAHQGEQLGIFRWFYTSFSSWFWGTGVKKDVYILPDESCCCQFQKGSTLFIFLQAIC